MKTNCTPLTTNSQPKTTSVESAFRSVYSNVLALLLLCCIGTIIYSNTFQSSFHFDDITSIIKNVSIRNITHLKAIWNFWPTRFITYLSVAINYHFHRLHVFGYHLFNLIVHICTALLAWRLTLLTLYTPAMKENKIALRARSIAFFTGLVFLTHPIQTQGVTYIIQRATSMATLFYLASLNFYAKSRLLQFEGRYLDGMILCYIVSLITAVMAMFTKEMSITLPLAILLYEFYFFRVEKKGIRWKGVTPFLIILVIIPLTMWVTKSVNFKEMHRAIEVGPAISPAQYLLTQFRVMATYLRLIFIPLNQNVDYNYHLAKSITEISVLASIALLVAVIATAIRLSSRYRLLSFGILWFFLTLLPESSVIPIKDVIFEHRLYLPMFGYSLFLVALFFCLFGHKTIKPMVILLLAITTSYSILTYRRNSVWKDEFTLWDDTAKKSPQKARPYNNRAFIYVQRGKLDAALPDYNQAIQLDPKYAQAYSNRGAAYAQKGNLDAAFSDYNQAIQLDPNYCYEAYYNRGNAYYKKGDLDQAISDFNRAIEINPNFMLAYSNRGVAYDKKSNLDAAISDYNQAIQLDPKSAEPYNNRGFTYYRKGNLDAAISDYSQAIQLNPNYVKAYSNRGAAYVQKGNLDAAISDYNQAIQLDPNSAELYSNRGASYARKGNLDAAISNYNQAIQLNPNSAELYYNKGFTYYQKGNLDAAISDYSQAIQLDPNSAELYGNRAVVYFLKGEYDKSWDDVYKIEAIGGKVELKFLEDLKKASGRER